MALGNHVAVACLASKVCSIERHRSASHPSSKVSAIHLSVRGPRDTTPMDADLFEWRLGWDAERGSETLRTRGAERGATRTEPRIPSTTSWLLTGPPGTTGHG